MTDEEDVILGQEAGLARITLNRPQALHALTEAMCAAISAALLRWAEDPSVTAVLLNHSEGRGFCAGGDIRIIGESLRGDGAAARRFFHTEYRLNHLLFVYPKPVIAVMDGVVMGGGAGLALPAPVRVATEDTRFAMPETGIGLFPDVGASHYLSRLPGRMGQWLALTGTRLDAAAALAAGVATHVVAAADLPELKRSIPSLVIPAQAGTHGSTSENLAAFPRSPMGPGFRRDDDCLGDVPNPAIDTLFAADRLEDILATLAADGSAFALDQAAEIAKKSPFSGKLALRLLKAARGIDDFAAIMRMEYRAVQRMIVRSDFTEGIRAFILDKDNAPRWHPASPQEVDDAAVDAMLSPLSPNEEWTPLPQAWQFRKATRS